MSTFGKVLLFLNLLAAGGLIYVSTQDWAKRQEISGVVLRYHLMLQGLPLETAKLAADDKDDATLPIEVQSPAGVTINTISNKLLKAQFTGYEGGDIYGGGGVVTSLLDELNRVEKKLYAQLDAQPGDEGKLSFLVGAEKDAVYQPGLLTHQAESYEERLALRKLNVPAATGEQLKLNTEDVKARLKRKFDALKSVPAPKDLDSITKQIDELKKAIEADPKDQAAKEKLAAFSGQGAPAFTRDEADRRRRITLFLMMLDPSAAWQKRVALISGLRTYVSTLTEQVARVSDITRLTERGIEIDQAKFESQYELLKRLALKQDLLVADQEGILKGVTEMAAQDEASKTARQTQLTDLETQLAALRASIKTVLDKQAEEEKSVFALQRKVGDRLRGNLELESNLDKAEQKKP